MALANAASNTRSGLVGGRFEAEAGVGEFDMVGRAVDEPDAQTPFEPGERPRQRRLRHVQPLARAGEAALLGDRKEGPEMTHLDGHAP